MADLDAGVDNLDALSLLLPLPYRLATVIVLGIWLWGVNLQVLHNHGIDTPSLIRYPARADPPPHLSVYGFATIISTPIAVSLVTYWLITHGGAPNEVATAHLLPNVTLLLVIALAFLLPQRWLYPRRLWPTAGRTRMLSTLRRISIGGLARTEDGKFGDVLLADALTSYARPLSELYIVISMMFAGRSTTGRLDRSSIVAVPIILALPFAIRFRQCIADKQPYNALKYATAFPAIALSVLLRVHHGLSSVKSTSVLWGAAALVNALYSFYWDVTNDWDLALLTSRRRSVDYPHGLRQTRIFSDPNLYYAMIAVDLVLRLAWALKLSPHLEHYYEVEGGIFLLEVLEVFRRFLWVFFRVETEWVRTRHSSDVLLGDIGPKIDED
ncbi:protein-ER retention protein [Teratosphaeriaceae sp. CCFEE 6253]|nr:protein-ER retention protein [Teratosphaeriaceae sp. CCFEE 6253]